MVAATSRHFGDCSVQTWGDSDRVGRVLRTTREAPARRLAVRLAARARTVAVAGLLLALLPGPGGTAGAAEPLRVDVAPAAPAPAAKDRQKAKPADAAPAAPLTIENARPVAVPPPPGVRVPVRVKAPPRFVAPDVRAAPPPAEVAKVSPLPPAPLPTATPEIPAILASPPTIGPMPVPPADPPAAGGEGGKGDGTGREVAALPPAGTAPAPPPQRSAARPPGPPAPPLALVDPAMPLPDGPLRVVFDAASAAIPASAEPLIGAIAARLTREETARLQLRSYASGSEDTAREARQLSLARALAVRERLVAYGVRSTRVDIRALGTGRPGAAGGDTRPPGPDDRVDVDFLTQ